MGFILRQNPSDFAVLQMPPESDAYSLNLVSTGCASSPHRYPTLSSKSEDKVLDHTHEDSGAETDFFWGKEEVILSQSQLWKIVNTKSATA